MDDINRMDEHASEGYRMPEGQAKARVKVRPGMSFVSEGHEFRGGELIPEGHICRVTHREKLMDASGDVARASAPVRETPAPAPVSAPAREDEPDDEPEDEDDDE